MPETRSSVRVFMSFSILSVAYILLVLLLPPNAATVHAYHLTTIEFRVLSLLLAVPRIFVWFAAFYGYAKLAQYSQAIRRTSEGAAIANISQGLRWLAWGLPVSTLVTNIAGGITYWHHGFLHAGLLINIYVGIIVALIAFSFIGTGTRKLLTAVHKQISIGGVRFLVATFLAVSITYCYATVRSVQTESRNPYQMPMWLILLTVVLPYLYAWLMGLLASYEIILYRNHVPGIFYKKALTMLASGLAIATASSITLQYITSTSTYLRRIELDGKLFLFYLLLVVYAGGFTLIVSGANKLKKIEEV